MKLSFFKAVAAAGLASLVALSPLTHAGGHGGKIDSIHFIIPGGAGGGWDGTARGTGEVLTKSFSPQMAEGLCEATQELAALYGH